MGEQKNPASLSDARLLTRPRRFTHSNTPCCESGSKCRSATRWCRRRPASRLCVRIYPRADFRVSLSPRRRARRKRAKSDASLESRNCVASRRRVDGILPLSLVFLRALHVVFCARASFARVLRRRGEVPGRREKYKYERCEYRRLVDARDGMHYIRICIVLATSAGRTDARRHTTHARARTHAKEETQLRAYFSVNILSWSRE